MSPMFGSLKLMCMTCLVARVNFILVLLLHAFLNPSLEVPFYGVPFYFNPFTPKQEYGHKSSTKIQISVQVNTCILKHC